MARVPCTCLNTTAVPMELGQPPELAAQGLLVQEFQHTPGAKAELWVWFNQDEQQKEESTGFPPINKRKWCTPLIPSF